MDVFTFTFCVLILLAGVMLTAIVSRGVGREAHPRGEKTGSARHQYIEGRRRMERRRARIWWRMEEMHAALVERTGGLAADEAPAAEAGAAAGVRVRESGAGLTPEEIGEAFEEFLRRS